MQGKDIAVIGARRVGRDGGKSVIALWIVCWIANDVAVFLEGAYLDTVPVDENGRVRVRVRVFLWLFVC
jgi:hypothetical protein